MTVKQIQHLLAYLGYYTIPVDGITGPGTQAAVRQFQARFGGLAVDGIPGQSTEKALRHAVAYGMPERGEPPVPETGGDFWAEIVGFTRNEFMELESGVSIMLRPVDYIRVVCEREMPRIRDLVRIFTHKMTELETHKDTGVSYAGMSASYYQLLGALTEKNPVWGTPAKDLSKAKLAWMLEDIVKTMTFGVVGKMQSTDITYLQKYVFVATDTANKAGGITAKGAETVINGIFRAAYTRKNGLAYPWQTKDKVDTKAAESLVSNPVMAEPKTKPQATPNAGEVTSTVESAPAEKPKKSGKKSGKKATAKKSEKVEVPAVSAGDNVTHSVLGDGVVSEVTKSTISVDFNGDIKPFQFPGAFADGFLVKK